MAEVRGSLGPPSSLRARNRLAVLQSVQARPGTTRTEIARRTGLSTTTVSTLVAELVTSSVLVELAGRARPGGVATAGGRPAVSLALNPAAGSVLGVHLGHADTRVVLAGLDATVQAERTRRSDVDHEPTQTLDQVASTAMELAAEAGVQTGQLFGVGVAVSAPVLNSQLLGSPPMLHDWGEVDIPARLRESLELPVHVGNDATLGALAEWRLGAGAAVDNLIYVMLSEGVGAGLVLGGRLYEGATGAAGELGHVTVAAEGHVCRCGNRGCLETVVGARALVSALAHSRGPACTVDDLLCLARSGDPGAQRLLGDAGRAIGHALAGVCTMLDPKLVIVGGTLADSGEVLVEEIRSALRRALPPVTNHDIDVVRGRLAPRTEALGAAILAATRAGAHLVRLAADAG